MSSQLNRSLQEPANNVELFAEECDMKIDVNRDEVMQVSRRRMVSMSINCRCHTIHTVKQRVCKLWYLRGETKGKGYNKNSSNCCRAYFGNATSGFVQDSDEGVKGQFFPHNSGTSDIYSDKRHRIGFTNTSYSGKTRFHLPNVVRLIRLRKWSWEIFDLQSDIVWCGEREREREREG